MHFLFHVINQDRISDEVNSVAERVHLIYWVLKTKNSESKNSFLTTLVDPIGHDDRLRDLRHTSSVPVTEFILLIS